MQVRGLPGRLSGTASPRRVFSQRRPQISKRREDATRWPLAARYERLAERRAGGSSRGRPAQRFTDGKSLLSCARAGPGASGSQVAAALVEAVEAARADNRCGQAQDRRSPQA